jgi:hypothetical protein
MTFFGKSRALSNVGLSLAVARLGCTDTDILTVLAVETVGCGFLPDRRPLILLERHKFWKWTGGGLNFAPKLKDNRDICDPIAGGYGAAGAHQHHRLARAMALDEIAALKSCSWGIGQVMGENFRIAGCSSVEAMVEESKASEDDQLRHLTGYVESCKISAALRAHDWKAFARGYNGPGYAKNQYDTKLAAAHAKLTRDGLPDLDIRAAQLYLTFLDFEPGPVDGLKGKRTTEALEGFARRYGPMPFGEALHKMESLLG